MKKDKKVFGTKEWAKFSANFIDGCSNNCRYCYARENSKTKKNDWQNETIDEKLFEKVWNKKEGTIMFPTRHDITLKNIDKIIIYLKRMLKNGNKVLIVSKPNFECIRKLTEELNDFKDKILFRFTIGSNNNEILKFWEPNAPLYEERKKSLKLAFEKGFYTSVSAEPLLDLENVDILINDLKPFITDSLWIGKMNSPEKRIDYSILNENEKLFINKYLKILNNDETIKNIYNTYKNNTLIKWKESVKEIVGIELSKVAGEDI